MPIIDDVKCPRCDRKYSGVRSRCPYCGARRVGFGKYTKDGDNARGKMLISILILAVFTVAAGILLFTTPAEADDVIVEPTPEINLEEDILSLESLSTPMPTPTPDPTPEPPMLESITIMYGGEPIQSFTRWVEHATNGGPLSGFSIRVEPPGIDLEVSLISTNEEVMLVELDSDTPPYNFRVIPVSSGTATLIASCGDMDWSVTASVP